MFLTVQLVLKLVNSCTFFWVDARNFSCQLTGMTTIIAILLVSELSKLYMYILLALNTQLNDSILWVSVYVRFNRKLKNLIFKNFYCTKRSALKFPRESLEQFRPRTPSIGPGEIFLYEFGKVFLFWWCNLLFQFLFDS